MFGLEEELTINSEVREERVGIVFIGCFFVFWYGGGLF